ncbi:hypothetical protein ACQE98_17560 [Ornithinimicrobium sp. W1679]|uniref:hypothetical protein n=1 Tax=Ornithinimicrobium sp. W1679 TaxID=3418770 RepID=UPI003CF57048
MEAVEVWHWINENGTGLGGIAAIVTAMIAILALRATQRDSHDRTRPVIIVELQPAEHNTDAIDLVVRNYGLSAAFEVQVEFDPELCVPEHDGPYMTTYLLRRYQRPLSLLAPGQELRNIWASYRDMGGEDLENHEPTPDVATAAVSYLDGQGRRYAQTFDLSIEAVSMTTFSISSTSIPGRLASVDKSLRTIANAAAQNPGRRS